MHGCFTIKRIRIFGARLHVHWSALVAGGLLFGAMVRQPLHALLAVLAYFGVILLHEAGHAFFAKRLGYRPTDIYITFIHGVCEFNHPETPKEHAVIAWGGVLAQLAVALPLILVGQATPLGEISLVAVVIAVLGYLSLFVAIVNLAPVRGLDGATAWKLFPILFREKRNSSKTKRAAKSIIRRVK